MLWPTCLIISNFSCKCGSDGPKVGCFLKSRGLIVEFEPIEGYHVPLHMKFRIRGPFIFDFEKFEGFYKNNSFSGSISN